MKLFEAVKLLAEAGVENPTFDARELFRNIGKMSPCELISKNAECNLPELDSAIERRCKREPLQYIIGEVEFYRESYRVSPECLIPRQETELLVDYAVKHIPDGFSFIDLCTGSGCIAISTLKNTRSTRATAIDISEGAIELARYNSIKNGVSDRINFIQSDALLSPIKNDFFALLSNPPYVTEAEYKGLQPEIYFEPKIAFVGGEDGLIFYKRTIELYKDVIHPRGFFAFEIGFEQAKAVIDIAKAYKMTCEIIKDYSENDRIAIVKKS